VDQSDFAYDRTAPLAVTEVAVEQRDGVTVRDVSFPSPAGQPISAYVVLPPESAPGPLRAGILWVHWFEPEAQNSNRTQFLGEAVALARYGAISVLPDAFWSTTPAQWAANPRYVWKTNLEHDRALSIQQVNEMQRALDLLLVQPGVDPTRIAFVGHDFGAMYGAILCSVDRRARAYVLMAGTYSFTDWFTFGSKLSDEEQQAYIKAMSALDPTHFVREAAPAALYFQFAHHDYYVPERAAQVFYDAASQPKQIVWYDAAHDMQDMANHSRRDRLAWLSGQLGLGWKPDNGPARPAEAEGSR
jgi:dienelactone hydrolase